MEDLHPKEFSKLPLEEKVVYTQERYTPAEGEIAPGTKVRLAGDHSPLKREPPLSVSCPACKAEADHDCMNVNPWDSGGDTHRVRRRSAAVIVSAHDTGTVIGHEPHPYPGHPRRHVLQMDSGQILSVDTTDLTAV